MLWKKKIRTILKSLDVASRKRRFNEAVLLIKRRYYSKGYNNGYALAKSELTSVIEHSYQEEPTYDVHDRYIVPSSSFNFNEHDAEEFYTSTFGGLEKSKQPNDDQLSLIFSQKRNTLAIAGAGSGKTTSLVNRLLFLHKQCKVPLSELTVFSFTRASVSDFRKKLIDVFGKNGINVTETQSEQIIRTFHSKVLEMSKGSFLKGGFGIFEFLKSKSDLDYANQDDESVYKAALKKANEEIVTVSELSDAQNELLYQALDGCYRKNKVFRQKINKLFYLKLTGKMGDKDSNLSPSVIAKTNDFEKQIAPLMQGFFKLDTTLKAGRPISMEGTEFSQLKLTSDAYIESHRLHVIFSPNAKELEERKLKKKLHVGSFSQNLSALLKRRAFIAINYSKENVYVVRDNQDLIALRALLSNLLANKLNESEDVFCPRFNAKFDGDFLFKTLVDVFFEIGTFAESIGLKVGLCALHARKTEMSETDKLLLESVSLFWGEFESVLANAQVVRFNNMFETFSRPHGNAFKSLPPKIKRSLTNIIIDEFQDISPEVANWVKATLYTLTQEHFKTSLMCVGDDFQSIYGWRGSSPEFLLDYKERFPSDSYGNVKMHQNYRSYQSIVDSAESCLQYKVAFQKHGQCIHNDQELRLVFIGAGSIKDGNKSQVIQTASETLLAIHKSLAEEGISHDGVDLLVMAKSNVVLDEVMARFKKSNVGRKGLDVEFQTYHRSKGLEARYCLLIEDCDYDKQHMAKNYLYSLGKFGSSFDDAQKEEAMRLAYVAVTRAKEKVWWVAPDDAGGSYLVAKEYVKQRHKGIRRKHAVA